MENENKNINPDSTPNNVIPDVPTNIIPNQTMISSQNMRPGLTISKYQITPNSNQNADAQQNNENNIIKNKYLLIFSIIGFLILIITSLILYFENPYIFGNSGNVFINIEKTCPELKNNISKINLDTFSGENIVLSKSGDVYFLIGIGDISSSGLKLGDCRRVKELSNVKDIAPEALGATVRFNDDSINSYTMFVDKGKYYFLKVDYDEAFPLEDDKYKENVLKFKINKYFYLNHDSVLLFVDNKNNIYNDDFEKYINGSIFDSEILSISSYDNEISTIITTKNYVYTINNVRKKSDVKIDKLSYKTISKDYYTNVGELDSKDKTYYGIKAGDIKQIYLDKHYLEESYYYIVRSDGNFYKFLENQSTIGSFKSLAEYKYFNILLAVYIVAMTIFILLSYMGEKNRYIKGFKKAFIFILISNIALAIYGGVVISKYELASLFTIRKILSILLTSLIYFTYYYFMKRFIWLIMHKSMNRSRIIFAIVYVLINIIITIIIFRYYSQIISFLSSIF